MTGVTEIDRMIDQWIMIQAILLLISIGIMCFFIWAIYVYVTSRRDWFEDDIQTRQAQSVLNYRKAEQIRLECLALEDRLKKQGIEVDETGRISGR